MMNVGIWLKSASRTLVEAGIETARLDSLILLEDVIGRDRAFLLAHPEFIISENLQAKLAKLLKLRATHTPLAYVRGTAEFYGKNFVITHDVLVPRPESEDMINLLKTLGGLPSNARLADVGAGSGALGISAKLLNPSWQVDLIDIDEKALKIARLNVEKFTISTRIIQDDLLENSSESYDILMCNLPYVPDEHLVNRAAKHEPKIALFGGADGLDVYRKLSGQLERKQSKPLYLLCESLPSQHEALAKIVRLIGYSLSKTTDFIQIFKHSV